MRAPQAPLREGISGAAGVGKREIWAPQAKAREDWEGFEGDAGTPWNFWRRKREIWACGYAMFVHNMIPKLTTN